MPERRPATEEISGVIEPVTFHTEDSGFCVCFASRQKGMERRRRP